MTDVLVTSKKPVPTHAAEGVERIDVRAVNRAAGRELYKKREPIYPKLVHGKFRTARWILLVVLLAIYYLLPWVRFDRGAGASDQAVLVDFVGGRFYFFWIEIWPNEIYYITGLLILAALGLFLVTSLFGRIWCGYACPQTIWTDLFILVERLIEGDRNARIRLAKQPWTASKIGKKALKHVIWLVIAAATGGAWIFYFHDAPTVFPQIFTGDAPATAYVFIGLLTFTTYTLAGTMREQVCTYMCPWPRIQAALIDQDALSVTYRRDRGEPRGFHKKHDPWEGRGDCIDCQQCVAACPMGIDIRDGDQLECINCALCIDACDTIMKKVNRPTGLIAYDTLRNIERRVNKEKPVYRFLRPRTVVYAAGMIAVSAIMVFALLTKATISLEVERDRNPTFVRLSDGNVRNGYTIKIENRSNNNRKFHLAIDGIQTIEAKIVGEGMFAQEIDLDLAPREDRDLRLFLTGAPAAAGAKVSEPIIFKLSDPATGETRRVKSNFLSGGAS